MTIPAGGASGGVLAKQSPADRDAAFLTQIPTRLVFLDGLGINGAGSGEQDSVFYRSAAGQVALRVGVAGQERYHAWSGGPSAAVYVVNGTTVIDSGLNLFSAGVAVATTANRPAGIAFGGFTPAAASQVLTGPPSPYAFSAATAGAVFRARTAATASSVFKLQKNGTDFGTITFAASGTTGTASLTTTSIAVDDVIALVAPATLDSTLAGISGRVTGS